MGSLVRPLLAAAAGALTTDLFFHPHFSLPIPVYPQMHFVDIISGAIVTLIAIAVGMVAVWCLPRLHALMNRLKNPVLTLGLGGLLLGILGAAGGHITLFKGLEEMQQIALSQTLTAGDFLLIALVKLAALVIAAASGFRGGRIFPAVFVGVALGFMLHAHVDAVPGRYHGLLRHPGHDSGGHPRWLAQPVYGGGRRTGYDAATAAVYRDAPGLAAVGREADDDSQATKRLDAAVSLFQSLGYRAQEVRNIHFGQHNLHQRQLIGANTVGHRLFKLFRPRHAPASGRDIGGEGSPANGSSPTAQYRCNAAPDRESLVQPYTPRY